MMTRRQRDALNFIAAYIQEHGISPSFDEINIGLGLNSKSGVHRLVEALRERGEIEYLPYRARSIRLAPSRDAMKQIGRWLAAYQRGEAGAATALAGIQIVVRSCGEPG